MKCFQKLQINYEDAPKNSFLRTVFLSIKQDIEENTPQLLNEKFGIYSYDGNSDVRKNKEVIFLSSIHFY